MERAKASERKLYARIYIPSLRYFIAGEGFPFFNVAPTRFTRRSKFGHTTYVHFIP